VLAKICFENPVPLAFVLVICHVTRINEDGFGDEVVALIFNGSGNTEALDRVGFYENKRLLRLAPPQDQLALR
jgi:hypothetical protein